MLDAWYPTASPHFTILAERVSVVKTRTREYLQKHKWPKDFRRGLLD